MSNSSSFLSQRIAIANGGFPGVDTIALATDVMPGQWILQPGSVVFGWAEQQGWGLDGATIRPTGLQIAHPTFLVRFWNKADWAAFQPLRQKYLSRAAYTLAAFKTSAIGILHPELQAVGITSVAIAEHPWWTNPGGKGLWVGNVKFVVYKKAKAVIEAPDATIPAAQAPQPSSNENAASETANSQAEVQGSRGTP